MNFIKKIYNLENLSTPSFLNFKKHKSISLPKNLGKLIDFKSQINLTPKAKILFHIDILFKKKNISLAEITP